MSISKTSPSYRDNKGMSKNSLKVVRFGAGANKRKRAFLMKYFLDNVNNKKALTDPMGCFELTGTVAIHKEPSIKIIQVYDAVAILRNVNTEDFIINLPANPNDKSAGNKAGFYYIPDKYRGLAEKAVNKELSMSQLAEQGDL